MQENSIKNPSDETQEDPNVYRAPEKQPTKPNRTLLIASATAAVVALAVLSLYLWPGFLKSSAPSSVTTKPPSQAQSAQPVIIYGEKTAEINTSDRHVPIVKLLRKVGTRTPETLVPKLGGEDGYPSAFVLSPDQKTLAINLEGQIKLLNLATKKLTNVFAPKYAVLSMVFSPDSKKLLVWDQAYGSMNQFQVSQVSLADNTSETVLSTSSTAVELGFSFRAWRHDDKVVMARNTGSEFTVPYYLDLKTKKINQVPGINGIERFITSQDGMLIAYPNSSVYDACDVFSGSSINGMAVIEPTTGTQTRLSSISVGKARIADVVFSPDNKEILFSTSGVGDKGLAADSEACASVTEQRTYYRSALSPANPVAVDKPQSLLKSWQSRTLLAEVQSQIPTSYKIVFDGQALVTSTNELTIAAQYYQ